LKTTLTTTTRATTTPITTQKHEISASPGVVHSTGSHVAYSEKSSTTAPIKTSHPVVTSSSLGEMTSREPTESVQQVTTPRDNSTSSTSSLIKDVMRSSEALKIEASPLLTKQETTYTLPPSQEEQILFSKSKEKLTSSLFTEIESSSVLEQIFSSENKEEMKTFKVLETNPSSIVKEEERSSQSAKPVISTSSPIKRTLYSQSTEKMTSSKVLEIESSPIIKEKETTSLVIKPAASKENKFSSKQVLPSEAQGEMTSSKLVTSPSIVMSSSHDEKRTVQAFTSIKIKPSSLGLKEMTSLLNAMMTSSQLVNTATSSGALEPASVKISSNSSKDDDLSQNIDVMTPKDTKAMASSRTSMSQPFRALIVHKHSSQQLEDMTSPPLMKLMSSSRLLTSSEVIRSTPLKTTTKPKHLEDMTSLQPKNTMTSSLMGTPTQIMTSSQVNKETTSYLSQTSSLENTKTSILITNVVTSSKSKRNLTSSQTMIYTSFKEVNTLISALMLSSSQIADSVTSSQPLKSSAPTTETTKHLDKEKTTTKPLTTLQLPEEKTTTPSEMKTSGKTSVAMTTSHPTHPSVHPSEVTHHTKPVHPGDPTHHGEQNNTNKTQDGHAVNPGSHSTMGFPDEPPVVEASADEKDDNSWQISIYVVCGLLIGMVAFVIVMVVRNNREMKR